MKNHLAPFLIIATVVLAGCLNTQGGPSVATSNGLIIKSFSPDFPEVRSGEEMSLLLALENVGESEAKGVSAQLFGLNFGANDWSTSEKLTKKLPTTLRGSNPSANLPGDVYEVSWAIKSPEGLRVDNTYTADVRTHFIYDTTAVSKVSFVTNNYLKSLPAEQAEQVRGTAGVTGEQVSGAPVQISSTVGNRPLIVYEGDEVYTLSITVSNVGSGNAFKDTAT